MTRPHLAKGDAAGLARAVKQHCPPGELARLLRSADAEVRQVAALAMGLVAGLEAAPCLARALHDPEPQVNQMAEHGLWSIWFRAAGPAAAEPFHKGVNLLAEEQYRGAIRQFRVAQEAEPDFAEAYNQCGIAWFLLGEWRASLDACRAAADRVPFHFGAISGMGHCYTHLDDMDQALACYRRALAINPRMSPISRAVARIECRLGQTPATDPGNAPGTWLTDFNISPISNPTRAPKQ
ncbi:MAG: tetratricopeptide repeat protein [Phycisphaeraceae bacterium]